VLQKAVEVDILLTVALHLLSSFPSLIYALSLFTTISAGEQFSLVVVARCKCRRVSKCIFLLSRDVVEN
jgi:hypothetical protein